KEQLGGFFIIDVPDLDAALEWAGRLPAAPGSHIEVRPVLPSCQRQAVSLQHAGQVLARTGA
ncbi:MAG TPA: YciI family protein, partial [Methylocella sp.]|nr:YciI family protein [Methylocella sp.]